MEFDTTPSLQSEFDFAPRPSPGFAFAQPPSPAPAGEGIYFVGRLPGVAFAAQTDPGLLSFAPMGLKPDAAARRPYLKRNPRLFVAGFVPSCLCG